MATLYTSLAALWEDRHGQHRREVQPLRDHLHNNDKGVESVKITRRRLFPETPELIRQCGAAQEASSNYQLTFEIAKL